VGQSITIKGEISGDEDLVLHGKVEGQIHLSKDLIIKPPSQTQANVSAKNVTVSGRLEGNVEAKEKVELAAEGRMVGDIRSPRVVIVDGAFFKGSIDMGEEANRPKVGGVNPPPANPEDQDGALDRNRDRRGNAPDYPMGKKK
jgi:cytoskeletal protein CcmA (bactofilin family)